MSKPEPRGNTPNTSIRIDPEVLHQARIAAVTEKKTLGAWLAEAIQDKLGTGKESDDVAEKHR